MLTSSVSQNSSTDVSEKKNGPYWWERFLFFLPLIRVTLLMRRNAEGYAVIDVFSLVEIAAMFLIGIYLLTVLHKIPWRKLFGSCMGWLLIYYVFCIFSFIWRAPGSSAPYIIYRAVSMNIMILYVFYLMSRFRDQKEAFDRLLKYVFLILLLGFFGEFKSRGFAFGSLHTNSYSFSAAVLAVLAMTAFKIQEKTFSQVKWYVILGMVGILLGTSGGSNIAFAMAFCFIMCVNKEQLNPLLVLLLPIVGILIYEFFLPEIMQFLFPGKTMAGIRSGTGRMKMWEVYINAWKEYPWLGYGFCIGERSGHLFGYRYTLSAHNGYISVLVNTGIAGVFFFGLFVLSWFFSQLKQMSMRNRNIYPVIAAFIVIMVNNMSVPTIGSQWSALSTIVLLVGSYFALYCQNPPPKKSFR